MHNAPSRLLAAASLAALLGAAGSGVEDVAAQKIICWKDKSGKVIGCGDRVPPEYQDSAIKELDRRGVTRKTTESAEDAAKRRAHEAELARQKAEENKRLAEQRRQDAALLATFSSAAEIDRKRDRELAQIDMQITQLRVSLKNATERHDEAKKRSAAAQKANTPVSPVLQDEIAKAASAKQRLEQGIAGKEQEKAEIRRRYDEDKKRYLELRGAVRVTAPSPSAAAKK